jgi:hypothetical protein
MTDGFERLNKMDVPLMGATDSDACPITALSIKLLVFMHIGCGGR